MSCQVGGVNVSRETFERLEDFSALVSKWTQKINLISPSTLPEIWERHVSDSAQLYRFSPDIVEKWVDIGSGGGFPGIVVAILAKEKSPRTVFTLIESDQRKVTFLRTAARELGLNAHVLSDRIESATRQQANVVSARALTALSSMMPLVQRHLKSTGTALLHKGKRYATEVADARDSWRFDLEEHRSLTDPEGRILAIRNLRCVGP
ncbi:16S rRNA (guanine(527)-N(7))-methyltransferase RsmG [Yoonia sediminilitoris]|uniref:Ribosomal RNA small subunit methyltransferase G n=1 Tax=Yoonia sediminilitoris TaxID=1286148 RepID=A0A2T6KLU2_9RHOB|nr:16S rRNA (guanine(527)-N(7))-methyltransferase RsmG [Yoonia sediminilitoris]PUB17176.1 16S rRNA (guanine527-N7)-methyltransferase [Yoonia sediminilitoris]RCW97471.1 16S rRNA (guanine527-N7)-methyltransferase [Yoonia sediminilitoris]